MPSRRPFRSPLISRVTPKSWRVQRGKTLSGVIQGALRQAAIERRLQELRGMQAYWSRRARDKGILTESDLDRYLRA